MAYLFVLPSPICEKKVDEACFQNCVDATRTELCLLHIIIVDQGGNTCIKIRTSWDANIRHGEDGKAAAAAVYAFNLQLLLPHLHLLLTIQLLLLTTLMVIG